MVKVKYYWDPGVELGVFLEGQVNTEEDDQEIFGRKSLFKCFLVKIST